MSALPDSQAVGFRRLSFSAFVILAIAVFLCAWSGFFIMDFLLSGIYTWTRSSRALALVCVSLIVSYEFIYKEHLTRHTALTGIKPATVVRYFCVIPYLLGTSASLVIAF